LNIEQTILNIEQTILNIEHLLYLVAIVKEHVVQANF